MAHDGMTRRILVTGATGYIGRHLVQRLLGMPHSRVYGFNRHNTGVLPESRFLEGDLLEADLLRWFERIRPDVVFHAVGTVPSQPFQQQLLINAEGTRRLLQALVDAGQRPRVIVLGSAAECGLRDEPVDEQVTCLPESEYGIAKFAQTQVAQWFARKHHMPVIVARLFNVYGHTERQRVIASLASQIADAEAAYPQSSRVKVQNLRSWRDFVHIDDVVEALIRLSRLGQHNEISGQIYNVASGHSTAISTVLDKLLDATRLSDEELRKVRLSVQGIQKEDVSWASIAKIREHTGWEPQVTLEEGLRRELNYWRAHLSPAAKL